MDTNRPRNAATTKPLPASLVLDQELARRELLSANGNLMTGCSELDDYLLLGGFERGSVVGVSAEEEEMGLLVSFLFFFVFAPLLESGVESQSGMGC